MFKLYAKCLESSRPTRGHGSGAVILFSSPILGLISCRREDSFVRINKKHWFYNRDRKAEIGFWRMRSSFTRGNGNPTDLRKQTELNDKHNNTQPQFINLLQNILFRRKKRRTACFQFSCLSLSASLYRHEVDNKWADTI